MKNSDRARRVRILVVCSLLCALTVLGAYIRIPFAIPVTLQLLFTNTSALLLGKKWGWIPPALYLAIGLVGLPVFSTGGGISSVLSLSFGFNIGFVAGGIVAGIVSDQNKSTPSLILSSILNILCVYTLGSIYYLLMCNLYLGRPTTLIYSLYACVLPFILPDLIKAAISILLYKKLRRHIKI